LAIIARRKNEKESQVGRPQDVDVLVGNKVRKRRKELKLTQTELGNAVGLTFQQIQKYERGANRIGASRLYEFSQILGVSIAELFSEVEAGATTHPFRQGSNVQDTVGDFNRKETFDLATAFVKIDSPSVRRELVTLMRRIADSETADGQETEQTRKKAS